MSKRYALLAGFTLCTVMCLHAQENEQKNDPVKARKEQTLTEKALTESGASPAVSLQFKEQYLVQMKKNADIQATITAELQRKRYKGDASMVRMFKKTIYDRNVAIETLLMSPSSSENVRLIKNIINASDSTLERYVVAAKNNVLVNNKILNESDQSKFGAAVRNRGVLKLTASQTDSLIVYANRLEELKKDGFQELKDYERRILPGILSDDQYTQLLILGNKKTAFNWAIGDWKELKQRGLHEDLDSAKTVNASINYNVAVLVKKERFGSQPPKVSASIQKMETPQPEGMKRVHRARLYNNPMPDKIAVEKTKFTW
ncbi:cell pole-organizing protein PopZ [Flavobacterium sp. W4I14]|nr:cell pole-organizing protein PopZ [Flavobacterium sp. W4I14]